MKQRADSAIFDEMVWCLREFAAMWGSADANSKSKRARDRRAKMWERTNVVLHLLEARDNGKPRKGE